MSNVVKGYKVFNPDWSCRGFQFQVGEIYEEDIEPKCCDSGFHFCTKVSDCFNYYDFNSNNKVAEVEALGSIDTMNGDSKCCTNKIHIIREISWQEVLNLVNTGKNCTGNHNTGDRNAGDYNTGDRNAGDYNTGDRNAGNWNAGNHNTGNWNTGNHNTGNWNTGNHNTGYWNTGNHNTGDRNAGDWNNTNYSSGCFNTKSQKLVMFDKPSNWTYNDWLNSDAKSLLNQIPKNTVKWISLKNMTYEEKAAHPECKTIGGYLKILNESECAQIWWNSLTKDKQDIIRALPNFDAKIFEQCTGIKIL